MSENTLVFEGTRWPTARVVNGLPMSFRNYLPSDFGDQSHTRTIFTIAASGHGRRWTASHPEGFWRDFVEIDLGDADAVLQFVRRRGDPGGLLDLGRETNTVYWANFAGRLGSAAGAYEPEGADGISHFTTDPERRQRAEWLFKDAGIELLNEVAPIFDPSGRPRMVLHANTLKAFMALSAANAAEQRTPMRRCAHCGSWFCIGRSDAQFCSGSCRAASFNADKENTLGKHPKEDQSERPGDLAKPLARAGTDGRDRQRTRTSRAPRTQRRTRPKVNRRSSAAA